MSGAGNAAKASGIARKYKTRGGGSSERGLYGTKRKRTLDGAKKEKSRNDQRSNPRR